MGVVLQGLGIQALGAFVGASAMPLAIWVETFDGRGGPSQEVRLAGSVDSLRVLGRGRRGEAGREDLRVGVEWRSGASRWLVGAVRPPRRASGPPRAFGARRRYAAADLSGAGETVGVAWRGRWRGAVPAMGWVSRPGGEPTGWLSLRGSGWGLGFEGDRRGRGLVEVGGRDGPRASLIADERQGELRVGIGGGSSGAGVEGLGQVFRGGHPHWEAAVGTRGDWRGAALRAQQRLRLRRGELDSWRELEASGRAGELAWDARWSAYGNDAEPVTFRLDCPLGVGVRTSFEFDGGGPGGSRAASARVDGRAAHVRFGARFRLPSERPRRGAAWLAIGGGRRVWRARCEWEVGRAPSVRLTWGVRAR